MPGLRSVKREAGLAAIARGRSVALIMLILPGLAQAQTASQITPDSFEPPLPRVSGSVDFSGQAGLQAPAGADQLSVTISGVDITGELPSLEPAGQRLRDKLVGGPVPVSDIFAASSALEAEYARKGYVLARVVLPAQSLRDGGRLRLVVVNGYVERIDSSGVPPEVAGRIAEVTTPLVGKRGLKIGEIERRLLTAGDTAGVSLRSALSPGSASGATVLTLDGDFDPVSGFIGLDNTLAEELGTWSLSAGVDVNSALGLGETLYLRMSGYPGEPFSDAGLFADEPRTRTIAGGAIVPVGIDGMTINIEGTKSQTAPDPDEDLRTTSDFERLSLRLRYPWIRTRALTLSSEVIFDAQSEDVYLVTPDDKFTLSSDAVRVLRLAGDANWLSEAGQFAAGRAILSFGLDAFGARGEDDATLAKPLSRQGADAEFTKLELSGQFSQPLPANLGLTVSGRAQTSFGDPLVTSEQFGVASLQELSAFDSGTLYGDSGWMLRGDLQAPRDFGRPGAALLITPYVFGAAGQLFLEEPTALEEETTNVSTVGVGVEIYRGLGNYFSDASLTLEAARGFRDDGGDDEDRFTLVGSIRF
ncbi:ShlB/FhaC/HecB family hemolysin secretion/activation protein [Qingshengfaniella alkalisoli]|uniref:ShlB/FhaC/HecB family hemolysin secretion/activation protein n=1 Tax=Qingshengfaniella alkalisoli TaxID=2599296 RepID=UPI00143DEA2B|nr:ShlB/FhaC/HecB family hemolysin secretion/activation protein [Qingshengfaniella alkalisoli]